MAQPTIEKLRSTIECDITHFAKYDTHVHVVEDVPGKFRFKLYTDHNEYTITALENDTGGYLGCGASSRKPRAGESWTRGSDLADGKLTEQTWRNILRDIVCYELVKVAGTSESRFVEDLRRALEQFDSDIKSMAAALERRPAEIVRWLSGEDIPEDRHERSRITSRALAQAQIYRDCFSNKGVTISTLPGVASSDGIVFTPYNKN